MIRIPRATLQFWIRTGKISAPRVKLVKANVLTPSHLSVTDKLKTVRGCGDVENRDSSISQKECLSWEESPVVSPTMPLPRTPANPRGL
jgi:hypothetical protein